MSSHEIFSERLRATRDRRNMSRELLAHKAGITSATIYRWEQGTTDPPFRFVARLADALGVSIDYLAGRTNDPAAMVEEAVV